MAKGRKTGGRRKGSQNKSTEATRELGALCLPDALEKKLWDKYLSHADPHIAWEAFRMAKQYKSGLPPRAKEDRDKGVQIIVNYKRDQEVPEVQVPESPKL